MICGVYSIRDVKHCFLTPTFDYNDQTAIRNFRHAIVATDSIFNSSPEDFDLFKIGTFDNEKGILTPLPLSELICEGCDCFVD